MKDQRRSQQIRLKDGRMLGFAEYGTKDGTPIFYFHGFPSSRLDWLLFNDEQSLSELNVRIIAADRPGYGLSDFKRGRKLVDWPDDVTELANNLRIESFSVLGISGGGPYALACAHSIGDRLRKCGIVAGMGPADAPGMKEGTSWTIPGTRSIGRKVVLKLTAMGLRRDPEQFISKSKESLSAVDGALLDQPQLADLFIEGMLEAFRDGIRGPDQEAGLYTRPWGFNLADISTDTHLWHGGRDLNVPISVGNYVGDAIPKCQPRFFAEEGHFSLPYDHMQDILNTLVE